MNIGIIITNNTPIKRSIPAVVISIQKNGILACHPLINDLFL